MAQIDPKIDYLSDARRVFGCLRDGGVAIIHMDVAYAIVSGTEAALRRVYAAKQRSLDKASGIVANERTHGEVHILPDWKRQIIKRITEGHNLPLSVIAPYRNDHPLIATLNPFMKNIATQNETVNFLLNASPLRDHIAEFSLKDNFPLIASSANLSHHGTKYSASEIEPEVRAAADVIIDYGPATYHEEGLAAEYALSSTQIDFENMCLVRKGICFPRISGIFRDEFGIELET